MDFGSKISNEQILDREDPIDLNNAVSGVLNKTGLGADSRVELIATSRLNAYRGNPRTHSPEQVRKIANSITRFGFCNPILIGDDDQIITGHGRVEAAKLLGLSQVPALRLSHLSAADKRAYVIADNRLAELAGWDREILAIELQALIDLDVNIELTGFAIEDVAIIRNQPAKRGRHRAVNAEQGTAGLGVSRSGDLWLLGNHQLHCGTVGDHPTDAAIDAAIRLWQSAAGKAAVLANSGQTFAEVEQERSVSENAAGSSSQAATREAA